MSNDLFYNYNIVYDVKSLILVYLEEEDIHWTMSNVNKEWNSICKSTFNDNRFKYKFIKYYEKLLKLEINNENIDTISRPEILVECPHNRLWTKGTLTKANSNGITVELKIKEFNPFNKDGLINDPKNTQIATEKYHFSQDGYHHIAPLNTIEKYRTVKPSIHNHLSKIISHYKNTDSDMKDNCDDYKMMFRDKCAPHDHFQRLLVDIDGYYCTKDRVLLPKSDIMDIEQRSYCEYRSDGGWICGIIDLNALELHFPNWNGNFNCDSNFTSQHDHCRFYQIPIIYDVTQFLFDKDTEPKTLEIDENDDSILCYYNLFKYGQNRYFTRIWIHPNDTHLYQPFGKHSISKAYYDARCLLATPALNKQNNSYYNIKNYDFIHDCKLTVEQVFNQYVIQIDNRKELSMFETLNINDKSNNFDQHVRQNGKYCDKVIQIATHGNEWEDTILLHCKDKHSKKYQFDQVFQDCSYLSGLDYTNFYDNNINFDKFETLDCYQSSPLGYRPIINFNIYSLVEQYENFGKLPYYTQQRIELVEQYLFKTTEIEQEINQSPTIEQLMKKNQLLYQFVHVKPRNIQFSQRPIYVHDKNDVDTSKHWDYKKWGNYTKMKYGNKLSYGRDDAYTIPVKDWQLGIIVNWTHCESKGDFIEYLYNHTGQMPVFIDITKQFDQFQQCLKKDWLLAHKDSKSEKDWDNRRYFVDRGGILMDRRHKKNNKVFLGYFVHLDDKNQIKAWL